MSETADINEIDDAQIETDIQIEDMGHPGEGTKIIAQTTQVRAVFGLFEGVAELASIETEGAFLPNHDVRDVHLINKRVSECDIVDEIKILSDFLAEE